MSEDKQGIGRQIGGSMLAGVIFILLFLGPWLLKDLNVKTVPFSGAVLVVIGAIFVFKMMSSK